jgi:uncharacterized SAM-binding protein YcdF (DUF218 family)
MSVGSILTGLLISPLPFIAAVLAGGLAALAGRRRTGFWLASAAAFCLTAASLEPVHDALFLPLENRFPPLAMESARSLDAIVVLGGGTLGSSPELAGASAPRPEALARLVYAYVLARQSEAAVFVSGGKVTRREVEPEASAARRTLLALGLDPRRLVLEAGSRNTWENARLTAPLLRAAGAWRVGLVTSAYHMPRSLLAFSRAGVRCTPAPTDYHTQRLPYGPSSFVPSFRALMESFIALREYAGLLVYVLRP